MKKIAIIVWGLQISGGGARQILELGLSLQKKGHLVDIFCVDLDRERCYPHLLKKLNVFTLDEKDKRRTHILAKYSTFNKIFNIIPHFLNKHHNMLVLRDLINKQDNKKHYDIFNYHETEIFKLSAYFDPRKNFWMMNDLFIKGDTLLETMYRKWSHLEFILKYKKRINKIIVLDNMNKAIIKKYLHADAVVVRSGLNQEDFYFKRTYPKKKRLSVLATGIFFPHRRFEDLVEAFNILVNKNEIKDISLNIIGEPKTDIDYFNSIRKLVIEYELENYIHFLGRVSEKELKTAYRQADIFVFPNNPQTWGLAVFEAMLSGCVAIVSKGAGAHEVLEDHKTAILVKPNAPDQIATAIIELYREQKILKSISLAGQKFVKENISWDKYAESMLNVFRNEKIN